MNMYSDHNPFYDVSIDELQVGDFVNHNGDVYIIVEINGDRAVIVGFFSVDKIETVDLVDLAG